MSFTDKFDKEDFYFSEEGFIIFTEAYHLKRGYCCNNNCKHCPWKTKKQIDLKNIVKK
ncbi:MAG TPA: DUF5522 domain-containing protein [Bacteroidia bacterium]|nr:DUF5522 domain-containing protein [Bacteroidia bacterium]